MVELYRENREDYQNFLRIKPDRFQELVERLGSLVKKKDTFWRKALNPELRIALTLRYLATGDSYKSIKYGFRVAENTISQIIPEVCDAIVKFMEMKHSISLGCKRNGWK